MQTNDLKKEIADLRARPTAELDARVRDAIASAMARGRVNQSGSHLPNPWKFIMKTPMTRWSAATIVAAALFAGVLILPKAVPSAFGIDEIIAAYKNVHFLHIKSYTDTNSPPNEFWIKTDESNNVVKARYYMPVTEDGAKLVTWVPGKAEVWFKSKKRFLTLSGPQAQAWLQGFVNNSQPEALLRQFDTAQKKHEVDIDIQKAGAGGQPESITVTRKANNSKRPSKLVFYIDPQTRLVSRYDSYKSVSGTNVLAMWTEFSDYNVPIDDAMFSLQSQLPREVKVSDTLNQKTGVEQFPGVTDEQVAADTARQFFQALIDKDYKTVGSIWSGELESYAREEFGKVNAIAIKSIGAAVLQTNWVKRGYQVACEVEVKLPDGTTNIWKTAPYMRPGDNQENPNNWHITGGIDTWTANSKITPADAKYLNMTPKQVAETFFQACATSNWSEVLKFWPGSDDEQFARMKDYLGGVQVISLGEPVQEGNYAGWFVPYVIKMKPMEFNALVANTNSAHRFVLIGTFDNKLKPQEMVEWESSPEALPADDPCVSMSPEQVVSAYFDAMTNQDWARMRKLTSNADVEKTRLEYEQVRKVGGDYTSQLPKFEVLGAAPSADPSTVYVKCTMAGAKKWRLAIRNDNPDKRFFFDGGL